MRRPVAGRLRIRSVRRLSGTKLEPGGLVRTRRLEARHGRAGVAASRRALVVGVGNAGAEGVVGRVPSLLGKPWVHARRGLESVLKSAEASAWWGESMMMPPAGWGETGALEGAAAYR